MEFAYLFQLALSLVFLILMFTHTIRHRRLPGAVAFLTQILLIVEWSAGSILEMLSPSEGGKLFWRNVQQIAVFITPANCLMFAADYCRNASLRKWLPLFWLAPVAAVLLIFTDQYHHLMRSAISASGFLLFGTTLRVEYTPFGTVFIIYNYCLAAFSIAVLGLFALKVSQRIRTQVLFVTASVFLACLTTFLNTTVLAKSNVSIPIVSLYLPGCCLLFYSLFRRQLFMVAPTAREKVFDVIDQGIVVTDDQGLIVDRNPYALHLMNVFFGVEGELAGRNMAAAFSAYPEWVRLLAGNEAGKLEVYTPVGTDIQYVRIKVYPLRSIHGQCIGMMSLIRDITERRITERELRFMADRDFLTGLYNRRGFLDTFRKTLEAAKTESLPVSVLMIDVDGLKPVNDTYGHNCGDRLLVSVAGMLRGVLRQQDAIGRIGGDEFAVMLPGTDSGGALAVAERIRREAGVMPVDTDNGGVVRVTLSIGVCSIAGGSEDSETLLDQADKAMYCAKRISKNRCAVWGKDIA